jgi:hypothetical protein
MTGPCSGHCKTVPHEDPPAPSQRTHSPPRGGMPTVKSGAGRRAQWCRPVLHLTFTVRGAPAELIEPAPDHHCLRKALSAGLLSQAPAALRTGDLSESTDILQLLDFLGNARAPRQRRSLKAASETPPAGRLGP